MDLGVLKGPAELLASKVKAFKNCLELATECLTNKDFANAELIYGGILSDLHKDCIVEALGLNDLDLFSLHSCFAYCSIGTDFKSEQALVILNSIHKPIKLPLVPYLKAFVHISNDRLSFAHDELQRCQTLLREGYNFKPNSILNDKIVPEVNDDFLKLKLNGLRFACELLKAKEGSDDLRLFKETSLTIGRLCDRDYVAVYEKKEKIEETEKKTKKNQTGTMKKPSKKSEVGVQTLPPKGVTIGVQTTMEKDINKQLLTAVFDIKNKMNNMQSKKDNEIKQLQKKNNELSEKLMARDSKRQENMTEFEFVKEQYISLEKKYEQSLKHIEVLQKMFIEQLQHKYQMQKNVYQLFEEKCDCKIEYLCDIQKYLHPIDRPTPDECKQEVSMWRNTLSKISGAKRDFEAYYRTVDDMIVAKKYSTIKTNEWPPLPFIPNDVQDVIYRNFRVIMQQSQSLYSLAVPNNGYMSSFLGPMGNYKENEHNPNFFVNGYNNYKEDGRTTGSPFGMQYNPAPFTNGFKPPLYQPFNPPPMHPQHRPQYTQPPPQNKKPEAKPPSPTSSESSSPYQTEQELLAFLQCSLKEVPEEELINAVCTVRDSAGKPLINIPKKNVLEEIRKVLKKNAAAKSAWESIFSSSTKSSWNNVNKNQWHNDHSDNKCCICFEDYDDRSSHSLPCQHEFHKKCITNWLKVQSACPVCRVHAVIDEEYPPLKV